MADITTAELKQIFSTADEAKLNEVRDAFNKGYSCFSLDTNLRRAHFFAQVLEEVGTGAEARAENMNYASTALPGLFGYFKKNPGDATKYGRTASRKANLQAIANRAYANRIGNGDVASGDGWKFRGKGYLQLTGRSNYAEIQNFIKASLPDCGIDILNNEADILGTKGAMLSAMAFWCKNKIHQTADGGNSDEVVNKVTRIVNEKTDSYAKRVAHFHKMKMVFHV